MKVSDILLAKGSTVVTIKPSETIGALSQRLRENRIGAAIVSRDGTMVDGVISERDIAYGLAIHKAELHTLPVSELMTKTVVTCSPMRAWQMSPRRCGRATFATFRWKRADASLA